MLFPIKTLNEARCSSANLEPLLLLLIAVYYVWGLLLLVKLMVDGGLLMKFISLEVGVRIVCTPPFVWGIDASNLSVRASLATSWITLCWKELKCCLI